MLANRTATNIDRDDTVVLYPTFGHLARHGRTWRIPLTCAVFRQGGTCRRKRVLLKLFQRLNRFHPSDEQRELFERRVRDFVAPTVSGKCLAVRVGSDIYSLGRKTNRHGLLSCTLAIPSSGARDLPPQGEWLRLEIVRPDGTYSGFCGLAQLLAPTGISIVSDIDDTVKVTQVSCRRTLLENTFLREFEAVEGMSDAYGRWAAQGASFHYVSSSPWQLYSPLAKLFERAKLPWGTFHLRAFAMHDPMLRRLWMLRKQQKVAGVQSLLKAFPTRRFVLVGDSGERDPEIYGALARLHTEQIVRIFIRQLPQCPMSPGRCGKVFRGLDDGRWQVFQDPAELPATLA